MSLPRKWLLRRLLKQLKNRGRRKRLNASLNKKKLRELKKLLKRLHSRRN